MKVILERLGLHTQLFFSLILTFHHDGRYKTFIDGFFNYPLATKLRRDIVTLPSARPSFRPSVRPSFRPSLRSL
jgi:hypothetical protein